MKKVLMILIVFVLALPVSSAFAYTGGLLNGKSLNLGSTHTTSTTTNTLATDNDESTFLSMGIDGSVSDTLHFDFSTVQTINSFKLKTTGVTTNTFLQMYSVTGTLLYSVGIGTTSLPYAFDGTQKSLPSPVANVKKIVIVNLHNQTKTINEFDVFGEQVVIQKNPVTELTGTKTYGSVNLNWLNPTGVEFTGTIIKQNGVEVAQLANTTSSYSITGLNADTLYNFEVIAKYSDGVNSSGQTVSLTTDSAPIDATAPSNITNVQVVKSDELASFMYSLPVDTDFSHLKIYRDGELKEVAFTGTSYDDFSLVQNTTYVYKFVSVDLSGNESNGFVQSITTDVTVDSSAPVAPLAVEVTNGASSGAVKWAISSEADAKGYNVYVDGVKHNTVLIMANSYVIPNLTNEQSYLITVTTVDTSDNESVPSVAQTLIPTSQAMPFFEAKYDLKDVADGTSQWFGSMWLILAFSVGIPLAFLIARRVKGLLLA